VLVAQAFDQAARDILRKIKHGVYDDGSVRTHLTFYFLIADSHPAPHSPA